MYSRSSLLDYRLEIESLTQFTLDSHFLCLQSRLYRLQRYQPSYSLKERAAMYWVMSDLKERGKKGLNVFGKENQTAAIVRCCSQPMIAESSEIHTPGTSSASHRLCCLHTNPLAIPNIADIASSHCILSMNQIS